MKKSNKIINILSDFFLICTAISGFIVIAMGVLRAHRLRLLLNAQQLDWLTTGLHYQELHTIALLGVSPLFYFSKTYWLLNCCCSFWVFGIFLFSGSLYYMALFSPKIWLYIVPFGGLCFMLGWISLLISVLVNFTRM